MIRFIPPPLSRLPNYLAIVCPNDRCGIHALVEEDTVTIGPIMAMDDESSSNGLLDWCAFRALLPFCRSHRVSGAAFRQIAANPRLSSWTWDNFNRFVFSFLS
jgi:hypothetical protein